VRALIASRPRGNDQVRHGLQLVARYASSVGDLL
jgi:hypothetical protein